LIDSKLKISTVGLAVAY